MKADPSGCETAAPSQLNSSWIWSDLICTQKRKFHPPMVWIPSAVRWRFGVSLTQHQQMEASFLWFCYKAPPPESAVLKHHLLPDDQCVAAQTSREVRGAQPYVRPATADGLIWTTLSRRLGTASRTRRRHTQDRKRSECVKGESPGRRLRTDQQRIRVKRRWFSSPWASYPTAGMLRPDRACPVGRRSLCVQGCWTPFLSQIQTSEDSLTPFNTVYLQNECLY